MIRKLKTGATDIAAADQQTTTVPPLLTVLDEPSAANPEPETLKPVSLYDAETALTLLEELLQRAAEEGSEVTEEQLAAVANNFLEAESNVEAAVERYCWLIHLRTVRGEQRVSQAKVWETNAKDLRAIASTDLNLAARLKLRLLEFLDRRGIKKMDTRTFKLSARNNGGKAPLVIDETVSITHIAQFYPNLVRTEIDQEALRQFLENGGELPFARLGEKGRH